MPSNEKSAIEMIHDITWREGTTRLRAALPPPFELKVESGSYATDVEICIEGDGEAILVFSGSYYYPSSGSSGGFRNGFEWARAALAGFFAALPALHASALELQEQRRQRERDADAAETKALSDRAWEIYQNSLTQTR